MTRPVRPSVARKAKASGTPAKFEATPEKVRSVERTQRRQAAEHDGPGEEEADQRAAEGRGDRDADTDPVGAHDRRREKVADVLERELALRSEKRAGDEIERRDDQEQQGENHEGRDAQPVDHAILVDQGGGARPQALKRCSCEAHPGGVGVKEKPPRL